MTNHEFSPPTKKTPVDRRPLWIAILISVDIVAVVLYFLLPLKSNSVPIPTQQAKEPANVNISLEYYETKPIKNSEASFVTAIFHITNTGDESANFPFSKALLMDKKDKPFVINKAATLTSNPDLDSIPEHIDKLLKLIFIVPNVFLPQNSIVINDHKFIKGDQSFNAISPKNTQNSSKTDN